MRNQEEQKTTSLLAAEALVASLQAQLTDLHAAQSTHKSENEAHQAQVAALNNEVQRQIALIAKLDASLKEEVSKRLLHDGSASLVLKDLEVTQERKRELKEQLTAAQLAQRVAERQSNVLKAQVQELRDTLMTQQKVITVAQTREEEYHANRRKLEELINEKEARFVKLQTEYTQLKERDVQARSAQQDSTNAHLQIELKRATSHATQAQKALDAKCSELQSLHRHVTELLTNTFSPRKNSRNPVHSAEKSRDLARKLESASDKENVLTEVLITELQELSHHGAIEISSGSHFDAQWHNRLVECSLTIYELLIATFQQLQLQYNAVSSDSLLAAKDSMDRFKSLCMLLSESQHSLHNLLMKAPWMTSADGHAQTSPHLPFAHERFRHLAAPSAHLQLVRGAEREVDVKVNSTTVTTTSTSTAVYASQEVTRAGVESRHHTRHLEHPGSPPSAALLRTVSLGSPGADKLEEDDHVRTSNDSVTLEDLLSSLACNQSGMSSNNSSMCSSIRSHHMHGSSAHHSSARHHHAASSLRSSAEDAILKATAVSAEIGDVRFDAFNAAVTGATPPRIRTILGAVHSSRSEDSKSSRRSEHDESLDSLVSDLFNLSADSIGESDEDNSLFCHIRENR